uniref:Uncharacterized protein n=1 Tax=Cacopsylla melanoneura TaxID=428564 RepID=A0A8D8TAW9_9HEMI
MSNDLKEKSKLKLNRDSNVSTIVLNSVLLEKIQYSSTFGLKFSTISVFFWWSVNNGIFVLCVEGKKLKNTYLYFFPLRTVPTVLVNASNNRELATGNWQPCTQLNQILIARPRSRQLFECQLTQLFVFIFEIFCPVRVGTTEVSALFTNMGRSGGDVAFFQPFMQYSHAK